MVVQQSVWISDYLSSHVYHCPNMSTYHCPNMSMYHCPNMSMYNCPNMSICLEALSISIYILSTYLDSRRHKNYLSRLNIHLPRSARYTSVYTCLCLAVEIIYLAVRTFGLVVGLPELLLWLHRLCLEFYTIFLVVWTTHLVNCTDWWLSDSLDVCIICLNIEDITLLT